MDPLIESLIDYLETIQGENFSITGSNSLVKINFNDGQTMIHANGQVVEHRRALAPEAAAAQQAVNDQLTDSAQASKERFDKVMTALEAKIEEQAGHEPKFGKDDYPRLLELLEITYSFTLDCTTASDKLDPKNDSYPNTVYLGSLEYNVPGEIPGNVITGAHWKLFSSEERDKWTQTRFRTFKQEDGEIGMEIKYFPNSPFDEREARNIYEATRLSEVITIEEFLLDVKMEADWIEDVFGSLEIYDLIFEVVPAGKKPKGDSEELDISMGDSVLDKPLWIQYKGKKYNVHIWEHQD